MQPSNINKNPAILASEEEEKKGKEIEVIMANNEKSLQVIEFLSKSEDLKIWSQKFLACATIRGYIKLIKPNEMFPMVIPSKVQYGETLAQIDPMPVHKQLIRSYKLNTSAFSDIILSINGKIASGKVTINLVCRIMMEDNPEGNA